MRYLVAAGIVVVLIAGLGGVKFFQISKLIHFGEAAAQMGPPPEAVGTAKAAADEWEGSLSAVGSVAAARGVAVSAEIPGVVTAIRFESGAQVRAGQVLVELDNSVERAQVGSIDARRALAEANVERSRKLAERSAITRAQLDTDEAQLKSVSADLGALRAQIDRKVIRAPFAGRLGIRQVNLGQYLNPGQPVTTLESLGAVFIDFSLPQQQLGAVSVGAPVHVLISGGDQKPFTGKIAALDPSIDPNTRTVRLRAAVPNDEDQRLRSGMFVTVSVVLPQKNAVVKVPATAVVHASYGDSVFIVEDKKNEQGAVQNGPDGKPAKVARQQFVRTGAARGDFVAIEEGVTAGQEVVVAGAFKLRNGMAVAVNNSVKLSPSMNPRPENH